MLLCDRYVHRCPGTTSYLRYIFSEISAIAHNACANVSTTVILLSLSFLQPDH
jgi:hypothetical protein